MKIGIVCYPTYGGSGVIATELAKHLSKHHTVHLLSYSIPVRLKSTHNKNLTFHKIDLDFYPQFPHPLYMVNLTATLYEIINEYNLDILHLHYGLPHAIAAYIVKNMHNKKIPKFIITLHGTDTYISENGKLCKLLQFCLSRNNSVTAVSEYLRKEAKKKFNIANIKRIYNFVDTNRFKPAWEYTNPPSKTLHCKDSEYLLVHVSNFRPLKQVNQLIYAFKIIIERIPARLLLIGSGPQLQETKSITYELGLTKYVEFLGEMDSPEEVLCVSDLFILSTRVESFGLAALEALSCGTPVIGYKVGGLPEVVKNGFCGRLVTPNQPQLLAEAALDLLTQPKLLHQFSLNARNVAKSFNAEKIVKEYQMHYNLLLKDTTVAQLDSAADYGSAG